MKLLSCYIENYGKLKAQEYTFTDGINAISGENGAGKSTLASFIKAMFYGLESYRKDTKEFCDRLHFYPFDGGAFGGNVVFEWNGNRYKIERFFGEKSETMDTLSVYCNGEKTTEFDEDIGRMIFGIDKASFERTLFIDANEIEISSTTAIHAKLNNDLQGATDDTNLDSALKRIEIASKEYKKAKAGKDKISEETARITLLQSKIENAEKTQVVLYEKMDALQACDGAIAEKQNALLIGQKNNEILGLWEHYEMLLENARRKQSRLQLIKEQYPFGIPTEEESLSVQALLTKEGKLQAQGKTRAFTEMDELRLNTLSLKFRLGKPQESELESMSAEVESFAGLQSELRVLEQSKPTEEERRLAHVFGGYPLDKETLECTESKVAEYRKLEREYHALPATVSVTNAVAPQKKKVGKGYAITAICSVILLLVGVLTLTSFTGVGVALSIFGAVLLLVDGFAYLNKKTESVQPQTVEVENPEKRAKADDMRALENAVRAVLLRYGYDSDNGLAFDFEMMKKGVQAYAEYASREETRRLAVEKQRTQIFQVEERLRAFFGKYGVQGDSYLKCLNTLLSDMESYDDLTERKRSAQETFSALQKETEQNRVAINAYVAKYRLEESQVQTAIDDARECVKLTRDIEDDLAQARTFRAEKGLVEKPTQMRIDTDELNDELSRLRAQRSRLALDIESDEAVVELLGEYETEKAEAEERLIEYKNRHKLLTATGTLLEKASQNLKEKYVKPIKDEFVFYAKLLEEALGEKVQLSRNFEISFERNGKERAEKHLSAGQRSICALCFRLALIRNMYKDQTPFLVLDDPFTALDEEHMQRVQKLVKTLSNDMQIIYFVCHPSRTL